MINNALDFSASRAELARSGRTQVADFLQAPAAQQVLDCLLHEVPWTLAEHVDKRSQTLEAPDYAALDSNERAVRLQAAYQRAQSEFQYSYDSYPMVEAAKEGRDPGLLLHAVLAFLNCPQFLTLMRWLTLDEGINLVTAQATRYQPGQFLTVHDDQEVSEGRLFAYVINLTPRWHADWGGLLQFVDADGQVEQSFAPRYNSLSLFRVPQRHCVSLVSPWAAEQRLAITGWLLRRD